MSPEPDPPFLKDGKLVVRCSHSGCNATTEVGIDVDGSEAVDERERWRLSFIPTADGRLELDTAECPDDRVADAIDDLAQAQYEHAEGLARTKRVADEVAPDD